MTQQEEALANLKNCLKPGDTIWTILRYVSPNRLRRVIDPLRFVMRHPSYTDAANDADPEVKVMALGGLAARALGLKWDSDRDGVLLHGCGEDKGFRLVYDLGEALFDDGYALRHRWL